MSVLHLFFQFSWHVTQIKLSDIPTFQQFALKRSKTWESSHHSAAPSEIIFGNGRSREDENWSLWTAWWRGTACASDCGGFTAQRTGLDHSSPLFCKRGPGWSRVSSGEGMRWPWQPVGSVLVAWWPKSVLHNVCDNDIFPRPFS